MEATGSMCLCLSQSVKFIMAGTGPRTPAVSGFSSSHHPAIPTRPARQIFGGALAACMGSLTKSTVTSVPGVHHDTGSS